MAMVDDAKIKSATPAAVVEMARILPIGKDVAERLLNDPRMVGVWRELQRRNRQPRKEVHVPNEFSILKQEHLLVEERFRLRHWGIDDRKVSLQEQACAAIFAYVVIEFGQKRAVITGAEAQASTEPWLAAAERCRWALENETRPVIDLNLSRELLRVSQYFDDMAQRIYTNSAYLLSRDSRERGNDEARARFRALALFVHQLYGTFLLGTSATIATVALGLDKPIDRKSAENWSHDLLAPDHSAAR